MKRQVAQLLAVAIIVVVLAHVFEWIVIAAVVAGLLCAVWALARSNRTRRRRSEV
jgi:MFS superfamily sulfate permease-like transporter